MQAYEKVERQHGRRRAVIAVQIAVIGVVLLGFAALTFDVGAVYNARADLQRTADSAALAAASQLSDFEFGNPQELAREAAREYTERNRVMGKQVTLDPATDVVFGRASLDPATGQYDFTPTDILPDAVQVRVRHTNDSPNGAVSLYFARIFGKTGTQLSAEALAIIAPRDIAIVADLSGSHNDDSELRNYQLTEINMFDVWNDLPGGDDDIPACEGVACDSGQTCVGGTCMSAGPGAQSGPTWGVMDDLGFGTEPITTSYDPTTDPGLVYLPYNQNWSNAQIESLLFARGYNASEVSALMSKANDSGGAWPYRTAVALGLAEWNSGIAGGRWTTTGGSGGNGNTAVGSSELVWTEGILSRSASQSTSIWLDYINNYANKTTTYMYDANPAFRYRFGVKTFLNYLMERRAAHNQTPELANVPTQPMEAVKDAVGFLTGLLDSLDTDDRLSLEIYGTTARHEVDLTHDYFEISDRLHAMQASHYDSYTNTGGGIQKAVAELTGPRARGSARKVILLLTDGNANCDASGSCGLKEDHLVGGNEFALAAARDAVAQGIRIVAVSVGADANADLMRQIADIGQGEHFHAEGSIAEYSQQLRDIFERIGGRRSVELIR